MNNICEKHLCTGCGACFNKCPQNAISMQENEEGFLYPEIDSEKCINCGLCQKTCPICSATFENNIVKTCYAVNTSTEIRLNKTSSGGVFSIIAEYIIKNNGYVCGSTIDNHGIVKHIIINKSEDIIKLRGSKYVQSDMGNCYKEIKNLLDKNEFVFFVGTPCQVSGLKLFLQKDYDKLLTADLICHGVPSQKVFNKYLEELNLDEDEEILEINFRDKKFDWGDYSLSVKTNKRTSLRIKYEDSFLRAFLESLSLRTSCGSCKFARIPRQGDLTLADFWNIKKVDRSFYDKKGTSLVLLNNEKSKTIFKKIKSNFKKCKEFPLNKSDNTFTQKSNSTILSPNRNKFFELLKNNSLEDTVRLCNNEKFDYLLLNFWNTCGNYGAILTAYALQELIKKQGLSCRLLNSKYNEYNNDNLFNDFVDKYLDISNSYDFDELKDFASNLKGIFLGSDQVLRFEYLMGEENLNTFLLNFSNDENVKKIAFSASFGFDKDKFLNSKFNNKYKFNLMKKALNSFDYLSCREISGKEIYKDLFDLDSDVIIDPVLLLDKSYYENIINDSKLDFRDKIVTYILDYDEREKEIVHKIHDKYNLEVINLVSETKYSVSDWLNAVKNCRYFITDSFHGTCFAIVFNKEFTCIRNKGRGSARFDTLQTLFDIKNVFVDNVKDLDLENYNINYETINRKIAEEQKRCLTILNNILFKNYSNNKNSSNNKEINKKYLAKRDNSLNYRYRTFNLKNILKLIILCRCEIKILLSKGEKKEHYKYKKNMIKLSLKDCS